MTELYMYQIPAIGTKGVYSLLAPFTTDDGEVYECVAVRTISAYLAAGEDPVAEIYTPFKLSEDDYLEDAKVDMQIITLRNDKGYSFYVPARYISKYPIQDGIDYASYVIQLYMPPVPVGLNTTELESELKDIVAFRLGIEVETDKVQTSDVRSIDRTISDTISAERLSKTQGASTQYAQIVMLQQTIEAQKARIKALEDYIINPPQ